MNMFNTDSGFRPPSPLPFAPPSHGLFGEFGYDDLKLSGQDFLGLPTSPPPPLTGDPSLQLFNPSEQRYFSEFLDTLAVDQEFPFDASQIPNLPNMSLFTTENMPNGFHLDSLYSPTGGLPSGTPSLGSASMSSSAMDFDQASPSSFSFPSHISQGGSPILPGSPSSYTTSDGLPNPSKRGKTNKGTSSYNQDSSRISTPIHQLSNLSLNNTTTTPTTNTNTNASNNNNNSSSSSSSSSSNGSSNPKKNKRDEDEHPLRSPSPIVSPTARSHIKKEDGHERGASISSDVGSILESTTSGSSTTKRKPFKELLTEEEKRANHIASEQKRRNTIRNGFKDMTDIIPDLRDVNSSKSTILFKAVDFIKHLERQNRALQEKANQLESRLVNRGDQRLQDIPHIYPVPCNR
ncbi:hypothetical protein B0O80DRAFT_439581 [Mortierella sp. GBAus27b]|nr:hypothetical protein B0O80DRAFT_439581 [Mortierella sp. GBAus27b]